jgi:hypothetical protein
MDEMFCTCCASRDKGKGKTGDSKSGTFGRNGYVYIPPEIPQSCKPSNVYQKPTVNFDDNTVYKLSYFGSNRECGSSALRRQDNLVPEGHTSSDTTHRHDYREWPEAVPAEPAHPHSGDFFGDGPIPSLTTQKHDYRPKPVTRFVKYGPYNNIRLPDSCMEGTTITNASYQPIENCRPAESCKPQRYYKGPSTEFAKDTVHTMSYMPPPKTEKVRGFRKKNYEKPTTTFNGNSVYSMSYKTPGEFVHVEDGVENSTEEQCSSNCECCLENLFM